MWNFSKMIVQKNNNRNKKIKIKEVISVCINLFESFIIHFIILYQQYIMYVNIEDKDQFYEGNLICGKLLVGKSLCKFRLEKQKLIFFDQKGKRLGIFHMGITEINYDRQQEKIMIDSGTQQFYLKSTMQNSDIELNQWFKKLTEAQLRARRREKEYYKVPQFTNKHLKEINQQIYNEINLVQTYRSTLEEKVNELMQKYENHSKLIDDCLIIMNASSQIKKHMIKVIDLFENQNTKTIELLLKQNNSIFNQKNNQLSFYSLKSNQNFIPEKKKSLYPEQVKAYKIRQQFPEIKENYIKLGYSEILKNFKNCQLQEIKFPILIYQPLSFLQRLIEQFQHVDLLIKADHQKDQHLRIAYVMIFSLSSYYNQKRRLRLPFEVLENQTYTYVDDKMNLKILCKSRSSNSYHAQIIAQCRHFQLKQQTKLIGKYYGDKFQLRTSGVTRVTLKNSGDIIEYNRPYIIVKNIMNDNPQIDLVNTLTYKIQKSNVQGQIIFTGQKNGIFGSIYKNYANKQIVNSLKGNWDQQISLQYYDKKRQQLLWKINDNEKYEKRYGFSLFALQLNYLPSNLLSQTDPTDSRFRKDLKYLQDGKINSAEIEKNKSQKRKSEQKLNIRKANNITN